MKQYVQGSVIALLFVGIIIIPAKASAQSSVDEMLAIIQDLMEQIADLQAQLNQLRGDLHETLKDGLREGMTDEDIQKVQELLATDPSIYPEGLVTGYYGPLTRAALTRFQLRHELRMTGEIDEDTRALLEEYLGERFGDGIPPGLLRAPGIRDKVERRLKDRTCDDDVRRFSPLCTNLVKKYRDRRSDNDDDSDDSDDSSNDESNDFEVEIDVESDATTNVHFTFDGEEYEIEVDGTDLASIIAAVEEELGVDEGDIDEDLANAIEEALDDELAEENDDDSDDDDSDDDSEDDDSDDDDSNSTSTDDGTS